MPNTESHPPIQIICRGDIENCNLALTKMETPSIRGADLCGVDLRRLHTQNLDMRDCHLRRTDLRGVDLSSALLDGTSIGGAKISGVLFPKNLSAEEITLSLVHGTRMRVTEKK